MIAMGEVFEQIHVIVEFVAGVAIPPPGGQVVAAAIQITAMVGGSRVHCSS